MIARFCYDFADYPVSLSIVKAGVLLTVSGGCLLFRNGETASGC
jgi:hypothetical protein